MSEGFLSYVKRKHGAMWCSLQTAETEGLLVLDRETDSICPTNRLLLTYPDLHEVINHLINQWVEERMDSGLNFSKLVEEV